jgi:hypothetical protein
VVSHAFLLFLTVLFCTCAVYYWFVLQPDVPERAQHWLGLVVGAGSLVVLYLTYAIVRLLLWRTMVKYDCSEPDARIEMLTCRRASARRRTWYPRDGSGSDSGDDEDALDRQRLLGGGGFGDFGGASASGGGGSLVMALGAGSGPTRALHVQSGAQAALRSNEPAQPWRFVLYAIGLLQWVGLVALLPMLVYVPYSDSFPGSWHS